ncbi:site-specific integrase [Spirillospora sp. NPDC047279]|uniref:tyrosine-type recombinase/integrase n=1 Tax=Spirillospora sp. NPDC047279 TaxID=3155478 RepID=UPI0033C0DADB
MGFTRQRVNRSGKTRYNAIYRDLRGVVRSAGTYATELQAEKAWQTAEAKLHLERLPDPRKGSQRFHRYVEKEWFPNHVIELRTRENYDYELQRYILPWFGNMRMIDVLPIDVREWITHLTEDGANPPTIRYCMTVLSAIFTTALNDRVIVLHPCKGVKTPPVPKKKRIIVTPEQFDRLYENLAGDRWKLLVETKIETGVRWGELTELRVKDFDLPTRTFEISRVVIELSPKHHPEGKRFLVKPYPKDKEHRTVRVGARLAKKVAAYIEAGSLGEDDLLFYLGRQEIAPPRRPQRTLPDPATLGYVEPDNRYRHGTLSAYTGAKCRCQHCKDAYAEYRAKRRAAGKDAPRGTRTVNTDGHIPRRWFRDHIWRLALEPLKLRFNVRIRDLRAAHASWLLAGGADIQAVKERLGHASIITTEKYLGTLDDEDDGTLDAFDKIRNRSQQGG